MHCGRWLRATLFCWLACSCVFMTKALRGVGLPMLDVDLMMPQSFRPFANKGIRLGVHTEWSLNILRVHNQIAKTFDDDIAIDDLSTYPITNRSASATRVIETIKRSTGILKAALYGALASFSLSTVLMAVALAWASPQVPTRDAPQYLLTPLRDDDSLADQSPPGLEYKITRRMSVSGICGRTALVMALVACFVFMITLATHYDDLFGNIKSFLPMILKRYSLICFTHEADECQIIFALRPAAYALIVSIGGVFFLSAIAAASWPPMTIRVN